MKKLALVLLLLSAATCAPASAREPAILDIVSATRISGYLVWDAIPQEKGKKLKGVVTRGEGGEQLDIYLFNGKENRLLLTQRLGDRFVGMFPTADSGGDLIVVSAGTGGLRTFVFSIEHGKVRKILDEETKAMPEVVRMEGDEKPAIVTFQDASERGKVSRGTVYRWNGKKYAAAPLENGQKPQQKPQPPEQPAEPAPATGTAPEPKDPS
jgi:hypothetical protein